jgi:ribosomal protein L24
MRKLKKWDPVVVISGKFKWKVSTIENVDWDKIYLNKVNEVKKAVKWKWFIKKILPIHVSNIAYYDEVTKKPVKIKITIDDKWMKKRVMKKTDKVIGK